MAEIYHYDHLDYKGTIKDYSALNPGDKVRIPANSVLLRPALKINFENEKASMSYYAKLKGCELHEEKTKQLLEISFVPHGKNT
jgi:hypothetical protein